MISPTSEKIVISEILKTSKIPETLSADDFGDRKNTVLFGVLTNLIENNIPLDNEIIASHFREDEKEKIQTYLSECLSLEPKNLTEVIFHLKELNVRRKLKSFSLDLLTYVNDPDKKNAEIIAEIDEKLLKLPDTGDITTKIIGPENYVSWRKDVLLNRMKHGTGFLGTGLIELDEDLADGFTPRIYSVIASETTMGKAQPLDAKILTPSGWKLMGEIQIGDEVITDTGKACKVLGVFPQGERDIYKIIFSNNTTTECCAEHLWFTQTYEERKNGISGSVKELKEILSTLNNVKKHSKNHTLPVCNPIEFDNKNIKLTVHPYLLGCLIGDGSLSSGSITFTNIDNDIIEKCKKLIPSNVTFKNNDEQSFRLSTNKQEFNELYYSINELGLIGKRSWEKEIPRQYLFASIEDRKELLMGLLDTDGTVSQQKGKFKKYCFGAIFTTSSKTLCDDVLFLANSLGGVCSISKRTPNYIYQKKRMIGKLSYNVYISFSNDFIPFYCERKRKLYEELTVNKRKLKIVRAIKVGKKEAKCILIDSPSHLYVTDNFILTHNTSVAMHCAKFIGSRPDRNEHVLYYCPESTAEKIADRFDVQLSGISMKEIQNIMHWPNGDSRFELLRQATIEQSKWRFHRLDSRGLSATKLLSSVEAYKKRNPNISVVFIDTLQDLDENINYEDYGGNQNNALEKLMHKLEIKVNELNIHVCLISQFARDKNAKKSGRYIPNEDRLRGSGSIGAKATWILHPYRPFRHEGEGEDNEMQLWLIKNRDGAAMIYHSYEFIGNEFRVGNYIGRNQ